MEKSNGKKLVSRLNIRVVAGLENACGIFSKHKNGKKYFVQVSQTHFFAEIYCK